MPVKPLIQTMRFTGFVAKLGTVIRVHKDDLSRQFQYKSGFRVSNLSGCHASETFAVLSEMALAGKSHLGCNIGDRQICSL
jgi:hypothetical protein